MGDPGGALKSVLVVDDDSTMLRYLDRVIRPMGHNVHLASDAFEALEILVHEGGVGLVLTDIEMPSMTGIALRAAILRSASFCDVPVVLMTGGTGDAAPKDATVLSKPLSPTVIRSVVSLHLNKGCPMNSLIDGQ
jgi:CheY-like chemotaxis protein